MSDDPNAAVNAAMLAGNMYGPNPYTKYPNGIPPTSYRGMPTDAQGNPIQPPPGTTLNSHPMASAMDPTLGPSSGAQFPTGSPLWQGQQTGASPAQMQGMFSQMQPTYGNGVTNPNYAQSMMAMMGGAGRGGAAQQPGAQGAPGTPDNSYRNALDMLSNPGDIKTPGANVPATKPVTQQPSVLSQFLAGNQGGSSGGYSNAGFFDTLNRLKAMSQ